MNDKTGDKNDDKGPWINPEMLPFQKSFNKVLHNLHSSGKAAAVAAMMNSGQIPMATDPVNASCQFDVLTDFGWKLDLLRGIYTQPNIAP